MNYNFGLAPLRRPLVVWLALLIAVLGAIAPTLSHSLARTGDVPLVEICTSLGPRWVAMTDSSDSSGQQKSELRIEHCPFCRHAFEHVLPPPRAALQGFGIVGEPMGLMAEQAFVFSTLDALIPPPRGPPELV